MASVPSLGNQLYLYRLLTREIGAGKQTLLPRIEEVLEGDGILVQDLEAENCRELMEALPFVKVTAFKGGRAYGTVIAQPDWDAALAKTESSKGDKAAKAGKPWKRKKGTSALRPVKPGHRKKPRSKERDEVPGSQEVAPQTERDEVPGSPEVAPQTERDEVPGSPELTAAPDPEAAPRDKVPGTTEPGPAPELERDEVPGSPRQPTISLNITYNPYEPFDDEFPDPAPTAAPNEPGTMQHKVPTAANEPGTTTQPSGKREPGTMQRARTTTRLPKDFRGEVATDSQVFSELASMLPPDVSPLDLLGEDWLIARSEGTAHVDGAMVHFPLRYRSATVETPLEATVRRTAPTASGKRWKLVSIEPATTSHKAERTEKPTATTASSRDTGGTDTAHARPEGDIPLPTVGLEGLPLANPSPWMLLAEKPHNENLANPRKAVAATIAVDSWSAALERLANLAQPEDWSTSSTAAATTTDYPVLREYLTITIARVVEQDKILSSATGNVAAFATGLLTPHGHPIYGCLSALEEGPAPWEFAGWLAPDATDEPTDEPGTMTQLAGAGTDVDEPGTMTQPGAASAAAAADEPAASEPGTMTRPREIWAQIDGHPQQATYFSSLEDVCIAPNATLGVSPRLTLTASESGASERITAACALSFRRAQQSHHLIAPAFDPQSASIKLLLPFCLPEESQDTHALVCSHREDGSYRAYALISLEDARVAARPTGRTQPAWIATA